jgi:hypothetical protein
VRPVECPSDDFWVLAATGDRLVYAVTTARTLVVAPQLKGGCEIRHPVLVKGEAVLAAGELEIAVAGSHRVVLELSNKSGHYQPDPACLDVAVEVLERLAFELTAGAVRPYAGG